MWVLRDFYSKLKMKLWSYSLSSPTQDTGHQNWIRHGPFPGNAACPHNQAWGLRWRLSSISCSETLIICRVFLGLAAQNTDKQHWCALGIVRNADSQVLHPRTRNWNVRFSKGSRWHIKVLKELLEGHGSQIWLCLQATWRDLKGIDAHALQSLWVRLFLKLSRPFWCVAMFENHHSKIVSSELSYVYSSQGGWFPFINSAELSGILILHQPSAKQQRLVISPCSWGVQGFIQEADD